MWVTCRRGDCRTRRMAGCTAPAWRDLDLVCRATALCEVNAAQVLEPVWWRRVAGIAARWRWVVPATVSDRVHLLCHLLPCVTLNWRCPNHYCSMSFLVLTSDHVTCHSNRSSHYRPGSRRDSAHAHAQWAVFRLRAGSASAPPSPVWLPYCDSSDYSQDWALAGGQVWVRGTVACSAIAALQRHHHHRHHWHHP